MTEDQTRTCEHCGKPPKRTQKRFCSRACWDAYRSPPIVLIDETLKGQDITHEQQKEKRSRLLEAYSIALELAQQRRVRLARESQAGAASQASTECP